jgi:hypothetical protein
MTRKEGREMSIEVACRCGKTFKARDQHAGLRAKCPACGAILDIPRAPSEPPAIPVEDRKPDGGQDPVPYAESREPLIWISFAAGLIIFVLVGILLINRSQRNVANREVEDNVRAASAFMSENRHEEAIGLLETTLGIRNATNLASARLLLDKAREAKADHDDSRLIEKAERLLSDGNTEAAVDSLKARLTAMRDPNKSRAMAIIESVHRASSDTAVLNELSKLTYAELNDPVAVGSLISRFRTSHESVREIFRRNLMAKIPAERTRREEAKRKAEVELRARMKQVLQKWLEDGRKAKEAEEKRLAKEAKIAEAQKAREESRKRSFKGFGQEATRTFSLSAGLAVITLKHRGSSNFIVSLLDNAGDRRDSFVNTIGSCSISRAVHITRDGDYLLNIKADGAWEIVIAQPLPHESDFSFFFGGDGTSATKQFKLSEGLCRVKLKHRGTSNFMVHLLDEEGGVDEHVVNEIGGYDGSQALKIKKTGTYIFDVIADGEWSIEVE